MVPEEQVAWLRSNTSMLHKRLNGALSEDKQIQKIVINLLEEKNDANLLKKTDDIVRLQGFLKDCKKREAVASHEALAIMESIQNLQSNPPALIHALGVLVYEKLRCFLSTKMREILLLLSFPVTHLQRNWERWT